MFTPNVLFGTNHSNAQDSRAWFANCWMSSGLRSTRSFPWTTPALLMSMVGSPIYKSWDELTWDLNWKSRPLRRSFWKQFGPLPISKRHTDSKKYCLDKMEWGSAKLSGKDPTVVCYDGFYVQNNHRDISNRQSVGQKFTNTRSATSKDDDLIAPVQARGGKYQATLVSVEPWTPFDKPYVGGLWWWKLDIIVDNSQ